MSKNVYLACPYSHDDPKMMERRSEAATRAAGSLIQGKVGFLDDEQDKRVQVFSPLTHSRPIEQNGGVEDKWEIWQRQDFSFIKDWANMLVVLTAAGWRESTGVTEEIELAEELGLPIRYISPVEYATQIIGINGRKRAGKDTFADGLVDRYGYEKMALADSIKEAAKAIFHFSEEQVNGDLKEEEDSFWEMTPREVLQRMGTEMFREQFGKEVWLKSVESKIRNELPARVVIPDVRFPNEGEFIREQMGGIVVRVNADERLGPMEDTHASETSVTDVGYDYSINNNGSKAKFMDRRDDMLDDLHGNGFDPNWIAPMFKEVKSSYGN